MVVAADLDRPVPLAGDLESHPPAAAVALDMGLQRHDSSWLARRLVILGMRQGEEIRVGNGQERAVERAGKITIVTGNGVVDRHQICA